MTMVPLDARFTITYEEGIYEIVFQDMKGTTLDQYFSQLEAIFQQTELTKKIYLLLHTTADLPSFQNLATRDQALRAKLGKVPYVRLAVLYPSQSHHSFVNLMLRVINVNRHMEMQMFPLQEREAARLWLHR
jgi:hypothetical protein